ncbi:uncharacterized protein LOC136092732 [Hydra vulgaris]|uniref:uncharacterized protein LOC136092732 n=1 Tax=Hydra vulgaris TaxID=6087 RepID=UPI0032EA6FB1
MPPKKEEEKKLDDLLERIKQLESKLNFKEERIKNLEERIIKLEEENTSNKNNPLAIETAERARRENNVIVFGLNHSAKSDLNERKEDDQIEVLKVIKDINLESVQIKRITRLRSKDMSQKSPVILELDNVHARNQVLKAAFRNMDKIPNNYFNTDMTEAERILTKQLRSEVKILNGNSDINNSSFYYGIRTEIEISSPDIIFITETWWIDTSARIKPGYNLYRRDRMSLPGSNDLVNFQNVINSIKESYNYFSKTKIYTEVLICGDFNFPSLNSIWNSSYESVCIGEKERQFLECIEECYLTQHVKKPTIQLNDTKLTNILDLVFTASPFRISSLVHMDPLGKTKRCHHVLNFNFNYQLHNRKNESITTKRVYMKGNYHEFSKYLNKFDWSHEFTGLNVDQCYESFIRTIEYRCKDFISSFNQKTTESKRSLWMNKELKHEIRYKASHFKNLDLKEEYKLKNNKLKAKDHIRAISIENNEISTDSQVIANQLNRFFNSVFINESLTNMPTCENITEKICPTPLFNEKDIKKRLLNLNVHKSLGIDRIHPMFLNKCADSLARPLCMIFNQSFLTGTLPTSWLKANITPIFKNGDRLNAGNYRPISLTSVVCKVMESIVKDTIKNHLNKNKLIIPEQHGFIKSKNCVTNLLETLDIITEAINCGKCVDVVFLDFSKAFDSAPHSRLLLKLK